MYIYTYIFVYIYLYIYVHMYMYVCLNVFILCTYFYTYFRVCMLTITYADTHVYARTPTLLDYNHNTSFFSMCFFWGQTLRGLTPQTFWKASLKQLQSTGGCEDKGLHFCVCSCLRVCACVEENVCVCVRLCTCELVCGKRVRVCLRVSMWAYACKVFELHGLPNLGGPT